MTRKNVATGYGGDILFPLATDSRQEYIEDDLSFYPHKRMQTPIIPKIQPEAEYHILDRKTLKIKGVFPLTNNLNAYVRGEEARENFRKKVRSMLRNNAYGKIMEGRQNVFMLVPTKEDN